MTFLAICLHDNSNIVTNPPFGDRRGSLTLKFIERALAVSKTITTVRCHAAASRLR